MGSNSEPVDAPSTSAEPEAVPSQSLPEAVLPEPVSIGKPRTEQAYNQQPSGGSVWAVSGVSAKDQAALSTTAPAFEPTANGESAEPASSSTMYSQPSSTPSIYAPAPQAT